MVIVLRRVSCLLLISWLERTSRSKFCESNMDFFFLGLINDLCTAIESAVRTSRMQIPSVGFAERATHALHLEHDFPLAS